MSGGILRFLFLSTSRILYFHRETESNDKVLSTLCHVFENVVANRVNSILTAFGPCRQCLVSTVTTENGWARQAIGRLPDFCSNMGCTKKKDETTDIIKRDFTKLLHSAIIEILKNFPQSKKDDFFSNWDFRHLRLEYFIKRLSKRHLLSFLFMLTTDPRARCFPSMFGNSPLCFILCVMNPENSISFSLFQMYFLHYRSLFTFV